MKKKINKRICRKYADPGFHFRASNGLFHHQTIKYVIRTAVKNIDGTRTLLLYLYETEAVKRNHHVPAFTVFQTKTDFITLKQTEDGSKWLLSMTDMLNGDYFFANKCAFFSERDEKTVIRYCNNVWKDGFNALRRLQGAINEERAIERQRIKEQKIVERMKCVPCLPRDLKGYIRKEVMPHYLFYSYVKGKKVFNGYCTACRHSMQITGVKHNAKGICPHCKARVTFKSRGKRGRIHDRNTVQVLQKSGDHELIIRTIKVHFWYWDSDDPEQRIYENARLFLKWEEGKIVQEEPYYVSHGLLTPWKHGIRPVYRFYQYNYESELCAHLYCRNLDLELSETPWRYAQLKEFYQYDLQPLEVKPYLAAYLKYPFLEYLVKLQLNRLACDLVYRPHPPQLFNPNGKDVKGILGIKKGQLPLLRKINPGINQLALIKLMLGHGEKVDISLLKWCSEFNISDPKNLEIPLKYMTPHKLMQYIEKQYASNENCWGRSRQYLLSDYRDYLSMCEALGFDLQNTFVLFPERLIQAHDRINNLSDSEYSEAYDQAVKQHSSEWKKQYSFQNGAYMVTVPSSVREIVEEGQTLHHCVGNYVKDVVKNKTVILFIREIDKPQKPFCTVEVRNGDVVQARGYNNGPPSRETNRFIELWKEQVLYAPIGSAA